MKKVSEILGKNIISIYEGKRIGIIENVAFDKKLKKLKSFIIYDEDNDSADRLIVQSNTIKLEGENAVMIKNLDKVIEDNKNILSQKNPINANVYNLSGIFLGKVKEVLINDEAKEIYSLILTDNSEILQEQIVSSDFKTVIIRAPGEELPTLSAPKKKTEKAMDIKTDNVTPTENTTSILNETKNTNMPYTQNSAAKDEEIYPLNLRKLSANFAFLIGRRVEHDVYNGRGEKIVKRNTIITNTTLDACKKWGKLIILARNSIR